MNKKRRFEDLKLGVDYFATPNAYGWWKLGRAAERSEREAAGLATADIEDGSIEAWYEDIRQKFGQSAADTYCGALLKSDRKLRGR